MTEAEWMACREPAPMLATCSGRDRKLRLFACACARECARHWHMQPGDSFTYGVELCERFAEGEATPEECSTMADELDRELSQFNCSSFQIAVIESLTADALYAARSACRHAAEGLEDRFAPPNLPWHLRDSRKDPKPEIPEEIKRAAHRTIDEALAKANTTARSFLAGILRDIFGNPFETVAFDPAWRTTDVMLLAKGIYDEHAFDRMPILADALQDAGCTSEDILDHLRDPLATHVRGCWALDLVWGKE